MDHELVQKQMRASNSIHSTAVIDDSVVMGCGNTVGAFTVITGDVEIGDDTWIGPHVTIGTPAQFSTAKFELNGSPHAGIRIGNRVVIREYANIHQPSKFMTVIDDDAYIMVASNINHDCVVSKGAIISSNTCIAGFSFIGERANLGLGCVVHQFSSVGAYAMVGMGTVITKDVPPFVKAAGNPVRFLGANVVGMARNGFCAADIESVSQILSGAGVALSEPLSRYFDEVANRSAEYHRNILVTNG